MYICILYSGVCLHTYGFLSGLLFDVSLSLSLSLCLLQGLIRKRSRRACLQLLAAVGTHAQPFRCLAIFRANVEAQLLQSPLAFVSALLCCIPK